MKSLSIAVAAFVAFAAAAPAQALTTKFSEADLNGDGVISLGEFYDTQSIERSWFFFRADSQNDGVLTPSEFRRVTVLFERSNLHSNR